MKHLGTEAIKKFNRLQAEIKSLLDSMTEPLGKNQTYSGRLRQDINPKLDILFKQRDKYI